MSPPYSNFYAAFADMKIYWADTKGDIDDCYTYIAMAQFADDPVDYLRFSYLCTAVGQLAHGLRVLGRYWEADWGSSHLMRSLYYARYEGAEAPEVTLDAILSAMVKAKPEQIDYFIGLVDAYRQSIWNKPFNKEYYAALARGFQLWE